MLVLSSQRVVILVLLCKKGRKRKHEIKYTNHHHRLSVDFCPHVVLYSKSMSLHLDLELAANIALVMTPKAYPEEAQL